MRLHEISLQDLIRLPAHFSQHPVTRQPQCLTTQSLFFFMAVIFLSFLVFFPVYFLGCLPLLFLRYFLVLLPRFSPCFILNVLLSRFLNVAFLFHLCLSFRFSFSISHSAIVLFFSSLILFRVYLHSTVPPVIVFTSVLHFTFLYQDPGIYCPLFGRTQLNEFSGEFI
jgi:hypothetical protein